VAVRGRDRERARDARAHRRVDLSAALGLPLDHDARVGRRRGEERARVRLLEERAGVVVAEDGDGRRMDHPIGVEAVGATAVMRVHLGAAARARERLLLRPRAAEEAAAGVLRRREVVEDERDRTAERDAATSRMRRARQ
jgi:hypothetical protein